MTVTGPPDDYTSHLKEAAHEALSMSDIVERLRSPEAVLDGDLLFEAADEIEWLRVRVKFLEDELKCPSQARRALETKP